MDSPQTFCPWLSKAKGFDHKSPIGGMIEPVERLMLQWAASEFWKGYGEIVEIGCFAGLSTSFLAKGMRENAVAAAKSGRLHSFDLFQTPETDPAYYLKLLGLPPDYRGSFQHVFEQNIKEYRDYVAVHPGDIMAQAWNGRPVEILFVDCSESEPIFDRVVDLFCRSLIPGQSLIILQDFFFHHSYFLPMFMETHGSCLELVGTASTSMVLKVTAPFPEASFRRETVLRETRLRRALSSTVKNFGGPATWEGGRLTAAFAFLEIRAGNFAKAKRFLDLLDEANSDMSVQNDVKFLRNLLPAE